jgi:hypothetical protein
MISDLLRSFKGNIVFDMDEVLVDIFPKIFIYIKMNINKYAPYLDDKGLQFTDSDSINKIRLESDIREFLMKDEYKNLPQEEKKEIVKKMRALKVDKDIWTGNLYHRLSPNKMGRAMIDPSFIDRDDILSVTILTFSSSKKLNENKAHFVKTHFNHPKIRMVPVNGFGSRKVRKSDQFKKLKIGWDVFVDDMPYNIEDFADNFKDISGKRLVSPKFSYNEIQKELIDRIHSKGATFEYYEV